jgi:cell division protein FtsI (penicillin-binding protein 3)
MDRKKELLVRVYILLSLFIVAAFCIVYRVVKINVVDGDKWRQKNDIHMQWLPINADRGNVLADDGKLLATSLPLFDIHMDVTRASREVWRRDLDSLCYLLATHISRDLNRNQWRAKLQQARVERKQYVFLAKGLTLAEKEDLRTWPILRRGKMKGGLIIDRYTKREKPFKGLASRTIGEDRDNAINVGLEGSFDKWLRGKTDKRLMKKVPPGIWVPVYDPTEYKPQKGKDIVTTINVNMQDVVHTELIAAIERYEAEAGVAILMEVETGAIKAISNISKNKSGYYTENYNTAVGAASEPGSTLKLASTMALIDDGHLTLDDLVDVGYGKMKFYDRWMYDSHQHSSRYMDLRTAFEQSSNVGISSAAFKYYGHGDKRKDFVNKYTQFGLTDETGIEIQGEAAPFVKDPELNTKEWYGTTVPWMAHGYEMKLSPLQVLNFYNAVANDGRLMKPYLVSAIKEGSKTVKTFKPRVLRDAIAKPSTVEAAQDVLRGVVVRGTAKRLHTSDFSFSGKTGTTRVGYWKGGDKKYNASFCGYFPAESPKYSLIVTIYKPSGAYYGSTVAAPVFKRIAERCFALDHDLIDKQRPTIAETTDDLEGLPGTQTGYAEDFEEILAHADIPYEKSTSAEWVRVSSPDSRVTVDSRSIEQGVVPDVRGMGARDAVYLLEQAGLQVDLVGVGKVSKQSISPGNKASEGIVKIFLK